MGAVMVTVMGASAVGVMDSVVGASAVGVMGAGAFAFVFVFVVAGAVGGAGAVVPWGGGRKINMTPEHKELRRRTITGTDAPAIVGQCPYRTPFQVWLDKRQPLIPCSFTMAEQERMDWGNILEYAIASRYAQQQGVVVTKPGFVRHKTCAWMGGSPDYFVLAHNNQPEYGLEVKNVSEWVAREWGNGPDDVPMHYILQCQHYMMLTEYKRWDVVALFGGNRSRKYTLYANERLQQLLYLSEEQFYTEYVVGDKQPEIAGDTAVQEYLRHQYPRDEGSVIVVDVEQDVELYNTVLDLVAIRERKKILTNTELTARNKVMAAMGSASELQVPGQALVRWKKTRDGVGTDWERAATEALGLLPADMARDIRARHTSVTPGVRRFTVFDKSERDEE